MIKKRNIIAIIITILVVIFTNKFWFSTKPVSVDFDMFSQGKCYVEAQLNKKDNDGFTKIKKFGKEFNLAYINHVNLNINRVKSGKRFRIFINCMDDIHSISIKNIKLADKIKLDNFKEIKVEGAKVIKDDSELIIEPIDNKITLTYTKSLNIKPKLDFNWELLTILAVLVYLLSYKLTNYLAEFNDINKKPRIEIIFLTVFFIFLFIPMTNINKEYDSILENRPLPTFKPLFVEGYGINYNFGKDFNEWYTDRFFLRKFFILLYVNLKYNLSIKYIKINKTFSINKETGWMFYDDTNTYTPLSEKELNKYTDNIDKLIKYANKNNIKLYLTFIPKQNYIYHDQNIIYKNFEYKEPVKKLVDNVKEKLNYDIIYPVDEFNKLKKEDYVCYKTDQHLTDSASFLLYKIIMERIKKDLPDIKISDESDFNISYSNMPRPEHTHEYYEGYTYRSSMIRDDKRLLSTQYKFYDYKNKDAIKVTGAFPHYHHSNKDGKYKLFIIHDSMIESPCYIINTSFKEIDKYRFNSSIHGKYEIPVRKKALEFTPYMPLIEKFKPDILMIVMNTANLQNFGELFD